MIGYRNISSNVIINTQVNTQPNQENNAYAINNAGQTFYEIITQQPYKFAKNDISANKFSIVLRWNYDSIVAKQENDTIAKLANFADYTQNLPFIKKIYIDIAGRVDTYHSMYNNMWIRVGELTISGDYNTYDYKHYVFQRENYSSNFDFPNSLIHNIISRSLPFSIRVYGENYSNDYPSIETRALIFDNLSFPYINPPTKPIFIDSDSSYNTNVSIKNYITLTYFNTNSITLDMCTNALLSNYNIDFVLKDSLASYSISRLTSIQNISGVFLNNIYSDMSFNILIPNLMSGSNFYHKIQVRNIYTNTFSDYSIISSSKYTLLPNNNAIGTTLDMSIKSECYKYISNNNINNANILYFNINNSAHKLIFNNSSSQQFQITYPYFDNQHLEPYRYGYGKFIDNSLNLVTINLSINSVLKQTINYGGFDISENGYNYSITNYTNNRIIHNCNYSNIEDIYNNEASYINKGFRLKGYFSLLDEITNNNISNYFGEPSVNPYILNFNYNRHHSVDISLGSDVIHNIYIDNLIGNPQANIISNTVNVEEVVYTMSVASIKYFKLDLSRHYSNINSINNYIVGNRIIANYSTTNNIGLSSQNIILPQADICSNGIYIYNDISYTNIAYYQKIHHDFSFNLIEKIYNLNTINGYTINNYITTTHYCDYNSYIINNNNNVIITSKLDLSALYIYEISNIQLMGNDLHNIQIKHYNNHSHKINPCTLLYIDSSFSNSFSIYPNSSDFSYNNLNNLDISYNTYHTTSFDLTGLINPFNLGYKWIVFLIHKSTDLSNAYKFNNINYNIMTTIDGIAYLPLKNMLKSNQLFRDTIVDEIFIITDDNALMFGHATILSSNKRFFNIKQNYDTRGGIWTVSSDSNPSSYEVTANLKKYGSNVNGDGIFCPINDLNDDLTIYIGLKNRI